MKRYDVGRKFIRELSEVLGLDPDELPITDIVISTNINEPVKATITMWVQQEQSQEIVKLVQKHRLLRPSDEVIGEHS